MMRDVAVQLCTDIRWLMKSSLIPVPAVDLCTGIVG
jgi:hypothetical protein